MCAISVFDDGLTVEDLAQLAYTTISTLAKIMLDYAKCRDLKAPKFKRSASRAFEKNITANLASKDICAYVKEVFAVCISRTAMIECL